MLPRWVWDYVRATAGDGMYAEVRGWRFDVVGGRFRARPSISEVTSPCPTKRDVYLRRVLHVYMDSQVLRLGRAVHEVFLLPFRYRGRDVEWLYGVFRRCLKDYTDLRGYWKVFESVFRKSLALSMIAEEEQMPISVEPYIPGGAIGLSDFVRPDLMVGFMPIDITLSLGGNSLERKELALAGYALAIEAWSGNPVDIGITIGISINSDVRFQWRVVRIDDSLRRRFIEARDDVARIIEYGEDPGKPSQCLKMCPFREVCGV